MFLQDYFENLSLVVHLINLGGLSMHDFIALLVLSVALGSDAFSVAICAGLTGVSYHQKARMAISFGLFQFLMPILGLIIGGLFGSVAGGVAAYIGGGILIILGAMTIWKTLKVGFQCPSVIHKNAMALISTSIGVSIDALAVGVGYGLSAKVISIVPASVIIGLTASIMTIMGLELGGQLGKIAQRRAPLFGGGILVVLGLVAILRGL